jgi:hypothetical protein
MSNDDRFRPINGIKISEYDLNKDNGILTMMENRKHYTTTVFPGSDRKKDVTYRAYSRPIISWNLNCELNQSFSRQEAFDVFSNKLEVIPSVPNTSGFSVCSLCIILILPCRLIGNANDAGGQFFVVMINASFIVSCIMIEPLRLYFQQFQRLQDSSEEIDRVSLINNCVDAYTNVDVNSIR